MDYEGAVELISQLETGSSGYDEFTVDVLKAINKEIKLTEFPKEQNDIVAEALIKSLSSSFIFSPSTASAVNTMRQAKPVHPTPVQIPKPIQPQPQKAPEQKQPIIPKPIFQRQQTKPKPAVQPSAEKQLSAATDELKNAMGEASKIELPKINFNVKPKETKPAPQPVPPVPVQKPQPQPAPEQKQPAAKPIFQRQQPKPAQQAPPVQKAVQVAQQRAKTFKSVLVSLPLHDQIDELTKISTGIDRKAFDRGHMKIIINEVNSLYEYSQTEPKTDNVFEQRLRDIRLQRLTEVLTKLGRKGVA